MSSAGTLSVRGGILRATCPDATSQAVTIQDAATATIEGGEITTDSSAGKAVVNSGSHPENPSPVLNITDGTISATNGRTAIYCNNKSTIRISGGTVSAVGGSPVIDAAASSAVEITGGSIQGPYNGNPPTNGSGIPVYLTTLTGLPANKPIADIVKLTYGINDVKTDANGKLYFYRPIGAQGFILAVDGAQYAGFSNIQRADTNEAAMSTTFGPYTVTVESGLGSGPYVQGEPVIIAANAAPTGKTFDKWTGPDSVTFDSDTSATTTFTMLGEAVTVTATYKDAPKYEVIVTGGTGSGEYTQGQAVAIGANATPSGKVFDKWTSPDGVTFANAGSASTTFTMPGKAVTVTATYKEKDNSGGTPSTGGSSSSGSSTTTTTVTGTTTKNSDGTTHIAAQIDRSTGSAANYVKVTLGDHAVNLPSSVISNLLKNDSNAKLEIKQSAPSETTKAQFQLAAENGALVSIAGFDFNAAVVSGSNTSSIHDLGGNVTVTIKLTTEQIKQLKDQPSAKLYYYDEVIGKFTDMGATFNLTAGTVSFTTSHFSTYVIAVGKNLNAGASGVDKNLFVDKNSFAERSMAVMSVVFVLALGGFTFVKRGKKN